MKTKRSEEFEIRTQLVRSLARMIRDSRADLRNESKDRVFIAGRIRSTVRQYRDDGIISFDCCDKLQRALDY